MGISDFRALAEPADFTVLVNKNNFLSAIRQAPKTAKNPAVFSG